MKTSALLLAAFLLPLSPATAQINVSGSAEIKVAPDEIQLSLGVESRHETLAEAKRRNDRDIATALRFLKESGVPEKNVQTDYISIEPSYEHSQTSVQPKIYIARKSIQVKLTDVASFESILTGVLTNGVNHVHGIDFRTSQLRKHRDEARALAIRAAREKADALANELGVKRGAVQNINTSEWGGWWQTSRGTWGGAQWLSSQNVSQYAAPAGEDDGATLSIGLIRVSASVNVSFAIDENRALERH